MADSRSQAAKKAASLLRSGQARTRSSAWKKAWACTPRKKAAKKSPKRKARRRKRR